MNPRSHLGFKEIFESTGRGAIKTSRLPSITKGVSIDSDFSFLVIYPLPFLLRGPTRQKKNRPYYSYSYAFRFPWNVTMYFDCV